MLVKETQHLPQLINSSFSDRGYEIQTTIRPEKYIRNCPVNQAVLKALPAVQTVPIDTLVLVLFGRSFSSQNLIPF
jgi:hypothetical protein